MNTHRPALDVSVAELIARDVADHITRSDQQTDISPVVLRLTINSIGNVCVVDMNTGRPVSAFTPSRSDLAACTLAVALTPREISSGVFEYIDQRGQRITGHYASVPSQKVNWRVFVEQALN